MVDLSNSSTPSSRGGDDDNALLADVLRGYQTRTSNDEKVAVKGNLTSRWLRKTNLLRPEFNVCGKKGNQAREISRNTSA